MQKIIVGLVTGLIIGISFGSNVIAPRQTNSAQTVAGSGINSSSETTTFSGPIKRSKQSRNHIKLLGETVLEQKSTVDQTGQDIEGRFAQNSPRISWNMASSFPKSMSQYGTLAVRFQDQIREVSGGSIEIKFNEPGSMVATGEEFAAVRSGSIEAAFTTAGFNRVRGPAHLLFSSIPFGPAATEHLGWALSPEGKRIYQSLNKNNGVYGIICGLAPAVSGGWFKNKITSSSQINGLRMSITGFGAQIIKGLGGIPTELGINDLNTAFKSGLIDAAVYAHPSADSPHNLETSAPYYYFPGWHQPSTLLELLVNQKKWAALSKQQQQTLQIVCNDNIRHSLVTTDTLQFEALKDLTHKGVTILRWPDEILKDFQTAWGEIISRNLAENADFRKAWRSLKKFREERSIWNELQNL